jgi:hypothetical protein
MRKPIILHTKATMVATLVIIVALAIVPQLMYTNIAFGQITNTNPRLVLETFTARGLIGSLIGSDGKTIASTHKNQHTTNTISNTTTKNPYILVGNWGLNVVNKRITYFEINFTMVHADGSDRHTHEFTNFKRISVIPILLDPKGITFIGMMDIKLNGANKWFGVPVTVTIGKNFNSISITASPYYSDNHFMGQPIYGVITSLKDQYGTNFVY